MIAAGSGASAATQVVGEPGGASDPSRCQSLPPTGMASGSHASHHPSGVVHRVSSQLQCQTSISGGRRFIGAAQLTWPPIG